MRGRPAPRPGRDALPRPPGDGGGVGLVPGRGVRGGGEAGNRRVLRFSASRRRPPAPDSEVPPNRRRAAPSLGRGGPVAGGGSAPISRLGPVAAQPDGAHGRAGRRLPAGLRRLQRSLPHPVSLVPGPAPGRRPDSARRQDRGDRQAGTHRRPDRLRQAALAAARRTYARHGADPDDGRGAAQARPQAALRFTRTGPAGPGTPPWTCATSWNGPSPADSFR